MPHAPRPRGPKPIRMDPDRILDAAQEVFARDGLRAASLRAIAKQAGCDPALIYYHFDSKEAMFTALLARRFPPILQELEVVAEPGDPRSTALRLWEVVRIYHRHLKADPAIRSLIRGEIVRGAEGLSSLIEVRIRPIVMAIRSILDQGISRGDLRADLHTLLGTFFLARMHLEILDLLPTVLPRLMGLPHDQAVETGLHVWFDLYWRGIARDPLAPLPPLPELAADPIATKETHP
ncbi:TetR/AcrR family transcriptional regulator [Geothrix alkalitolerans]|uniref:TetR/AcrR family transcriptional regulator n=1 Tax=Geothrix alkalitolerans TaxID=2922724 RepID=UPI001FAF7618|nr:TetR/AcrR family transcriptional regulator [Geothrix alkalitolerans]